VGGVIAATLAVAVILMRAGMEPYRLHAVTQSASQLVEGNVVRVGGLPVGTVKDIDLTSDARARLTLEIDDDDIVPLHEGTEGTIRISSLSSVANRYVDLQPGPNSAPDLEDGATIGAQDMTSAVDLDAVLSTLDAETRSALQGVLHGSARQLSGREREANAGLAALNPAVAQTEGTLAELAGDQAAFARFLVQSATVVSTIAARRSDLEGGLARAGQVSEAVAAESGALKATLRRGPRALRQARATLDGLRATFAELRPTARLLRPVAPRVTRTFSVLRPTAHDLRPALADVRRLLPDLVAVLRGLPALDRSARPAFGVTVDAVARALPIVAGARPALPDVFHGLLNGFGGSGAGYYDANGSYAYVAPIASQYSLTSGLNLLPLPPLTGAKPGNVKRCPGSAALPAVDGSTPWVADSLPCEPAQVP
jgi:phospholipid/cholesterol/gamma-HCH transport system substrate-binding protein